MENHMEHVMRNDGREKAQMKRVLRAKLLKKNF